MDALWLLLLFAVISSFFADRIALASDRGKFYRYESYLPFMGITMIATCIVAFLVFLAVRFFPVKNKVLKALAWVLGILFMAWMLLGMHFVFVRITDSSENVYDGGGLWLGYMDRHEEERKVWDRSHWFGHGDEIYAYTYEEFVEARSHLHFENEDEEPYHSIVDERYKIEHVFTYFYADMLLNLLAYFYGKWVWLFYTLLATGSVILAISLLPLIGGLPGKFLYVSTWILFAMIVLVPALGGCTLLSNSCAGPMFTGAGWYYLEYGSAFVGPVLGLLLGITGRQKKFLSA